MKVLIADDHQLIRTGIKHILQEEYANAQIDEAADTTSLIEMAVSGEWDLVISDISMPGGGGLEALKKILEKKSGLRILIVTMLPEDQYAIPAIQSGACGFLNKEAAPDLLIEVIRIILSGHRYISPTILNKSASNFNL